MSVPAYDTCRRTDAVLAVYLDGELETIADRCDDGDGPCEKMGPDEQWGYEFVSNDSLADHLRGCACCQLALQRARRLDAVLASTAGRSVSEHVAAAGADLTGLADRWLQTAFAAAAQLPAAAAGAPRLAATAAVAADRPGDEQISRPWTIAAAIGLVAAGVAAWLCLTPHVDAPASAATTATTTAATVNGPTQPTAPAEPTIIPTAAATPPVPTAPSTDVDQPQQDAGAVPDATSLPPTLAGRLRAAQQRDLPEQATVAIAELGRRVADATWAVGERLAAANRLLNTIGNGAVGRQDACDTLLAAMAGCGNRTSYENALHDELLDRMRSCPALISELESRLVVWSTHRGEQRSNRSMIAASIVAARIGNDRLDAALRRALRAHADLCGVVAAGLRCGARLDGAAALLLGCWRDQVARGRQDDEMQWAVTWFAGQAPSTFAQLPGVLAASRSAADRVRCLLALGCANDGATVDVLLTHLQSTRRGEALAAALGLAALPHRVLMRLVPDAQRPDANLLRAALARAGLPAADAWLAPLALSARQRQLLHQGRLERFAEVANWFRDRQSSAE